MASMTAKDVIKIKQNEEEDNEFLKQLDKFFNNTLKSYETLKIGKTSNALSLSGANENLDVIINQSTIKKCISPPSDKIKHGHELERTVIEQLPVQLRNPVLIFQNKDKNSLVLFTDMKDKENRQIMIAVGLEQSATHTLVNRVASIYGRNNFSNYVEKQINKGNLIAVNKEKADRMLQLVGLQLPKKRTFISYDDSIAYSMESVKFPEQKNIERSDEMPQSTKIIENFIPDEEIIDGKVFTGRAENSVQPEQNFTDRNLNAELTQARDIEPKKYLENLISEEYERESELYQREQEETLAFEYDFEDEKITMNENAEKSENDTSEIYSSRQSDIDILNQLSENGDLQATNMLAVAFYFGDFGVERDIDKAIELFSKAADKGSSSAQRNLGIIFENNQPKDQKLAVEYYEKAANNENPDPYALNNLGACYLMGDGIEANASKAVSFFAMAAKLGDDYAKLNLADCLMLGQGVRRNEKRAFKLYQEAAESGNITALKRLSECCIEGKGTSVNTKLALEYLKKAADKGDTEAELLYEKLEQKLKPQRHTEASGKDIKGIEDRLKKASEKIEKAQEQLPQEQKQPEQKTTEQKKQHKSNQQSI